MLTYDKDTNAVLSETHDELTDIRGYYIVIDGSWNKAIGQQEKEGGGYALLLETIERPEGEGRFKAFFTQGNNELIREDSDLNESTPFSTSAS